MANLNSEFTNLFPQRRLSISAKTPDDGKGTTVLSINLAKEATNEQVADAVNKVQAITSATITGWTVTYSLTTADVPEITNEPGEAIKASDVFLDGFTDTALVPTYQIYGYSDSGVMHQNASVYYAANPLTIDSDAIQDALSSICFASGVEAEKADLTLKSTDKVV